MVSSDQEAFLGMGPSVVACEAVACAVAVGSFHQEAASFHQILVARQADVVAAFGCSSGRSDPSLVLAGPLSAVVASSSLAVADVVVAEVAVAVAAAVPSPSWSFCVRNCGHGAMSQMLVAR